MKAIWTKAFPKQATKLNRAATLHRQRRENRPQKVRKRVRGRSKRMERLMAYYRQRRIIFLTLNPNCKCHGRGCQAEQIHHLRGRLKTLLLDERFWVSLCASAHELVRDHPDVARRMGLLCAKGDWHRAPQDYKTIALEQLMFELTR
jgi:hypothetical protein